jgi:hypothetical protein
MEQVCNNSNPPSSPQENMSAKLKNLVNLLISTFNKSENHQDSQNAKIKFREGVFELATNYEYPQAMSLFAFCNLNGIGGLCNYKEYMFWTDKAIKYNEPLSVMLRAEYDLKMLVYAVNNMKSNLDYSELRYDLIANFFYGLYQIKTYRNYSFKLEASKNILEFVKTQKDPYMLYVLGSEERNYDLLKKSSNRGFIPAKCCIAYNHFIVDRSLNNKTVVNFYKICIKQQYHVACYQLAWYVLHKDESPFIIGYNVYDLLMIGVKQMCSEFYHLISSYYCVFKPDIIKELSWKRACRDLNPEYRNFEQYIHFQCRYIYMMC